MAATILNSARATEVSVYVVRAFAQLRGLLATHNELAKRLDELEARIEKKLATHVQYRSSYVKAPTMTSPTQWPPAGAGPCRDRSDPSPGLGAGRPAAAPRLLDRVRDATARRNYSCKRWGQALIRESSSAFCSNHSSFTTPILRFFGGSGGLMSSRIASRRWPGRMYR